MSDEYTNGQADDLMAAEGFYEKGKGQMGLFFKLFDGSICLTSREIPTEPGWEHEPVKTTNPQTKDDVFTYVKRFDKLIVRVVDVNKRRKEFDSGGKITNWNITIMAGKKKATLQCVWMDALLAAFLKKAPNIDFEKPILFGAFTKMVKGKKKQLIRIAQGGSSATSDDWTPVPYYWLKEVDAKGNVDLESEANGADGTILPDMEHDEEEDTWDSRQQKKFLQKHFVTNTLPKIKAIAERLGLNQKMVVDDEGNGDDFPTHTGERKIPVVTERPDNAESTSVKDAMTSDQAKELRKLAKQVNKDPDSLAQKFLEADFDDLSIEGAAYLKYKIEKRIAKARKTDPDAFPEPVEEPKKKKVKAQRDDDDDDDDEWGETQTPAPKKKKARDDDDDDSWGDDDQVLKDKDGNVIF